MTAYQVIEEMKELTKAKVPFAFSFYSYNRSAQSSEGVVDVNNAKLLFHEPTTDPVKDARYRYYDYDQGEPRNFYLPALMTFQGRKVNL